MSNANLHSDKELFSLISTGDHDAFTELVERHQDHLFSQAMAFLKDSAKAQDIVQEVFLSIWNVRHTLITVENPRSYLFITARNKIASEFKKKVDSFISDTMEEMYVADNIPLDQNLENKELLSLIQAAVNQMPPQRKQVFELGKNEGLKYEEIAERMNISPNTVKVHMVQALSFIRYFIRDKTGILLFFLLFR